MGSRGQPAPEQPWMATSACPRKQRLTCWGAVDRVAGQVSRLLSPCSPTPGFQDHRLEARLEAHHAAMDFSSPSGGRIISDPREAAAVSRSPSSRPPPLLRAHLGASTSSLVPPHNSALSCQLPGSDLNWAASRQTLPYFHIGTPRASFLSGPAVAPSKALSYLSQPRGRSFTPRSWQCLAGTPHRQLSRWTVVEPSLPASRNLSSSTR